MDDRRHNKIARRAYALFEERGRTHGHDVEDWLAAEHQATAKPWRIETPPASLLGNIDDSTLVLRIGIAVNALQSARRFFLFVEGAPGPAGERDRLWAFLIAVGFLYAAREVLRPNFPRIRELAVAGGAEESVVTTTGDLLSGRLPLNRTLDRMRNKLIFHWDGDLIRQYVNSYTKETVVWADGVGDTHGEAHYRVASDALTNSVLPEEVGVDQERNEERLRQLIIEVLQATAAIISVFEHAILGHIKNYGPDLKSP